MKPSSHLLILLTLPTILCLGRSALAHAFPDHADPRVGSTIHQAPAEVKIWFDREIEPAFSTIEVFAPDNREVDKKDSHRATDDDKLLIVSVPQLDAGVYKVVWSVVATDTHHTHGDFTFTIRP